MNINFWVVKDLLDECLIPPKSSNKIKDMDWSSLSIPSNLYKVHLNDDTVSSVDTDDEEVLDDNFDKNIQNEDINAQKQIQSIDIPEKIQVHFWFV